MTWTRAKLEAALPRHLHGMPVKALEAVHRGLQRLRVDGYLERAGAETVERIETEEDAEDGAPR